MRWILNLPVQATRCEGVGVAKRQTKASSYMWISDNQRRLVILSSFRQVLSTLPFKVLKAGMVSGWERLKGEIGRCKHSSQDPEDGVHDNSDPHHDRKHQLPISANTSGLNLLELCMCREKVGSSELPRLRLNFSRNNRASWGSFGGGQSMLLWLF